MKKLIFAFTAFMGLYLVSCDETTINPTNEKNNTLSQVDMLTSTLWERKYSVNIVTTSGTITENRTTRLEFNKGLIQQTFFLYRLFPADNKFYREDNNINWSLTNDSLTLRNIVGAMYTSRHKILKLTEDTLRFERIDNNSGIKNPFDDTIKIHTYYKVK
jgi:hypothetical protein